MKLKIIINTLLVLVIVASGFACTSVINPTTNEATATTVSNEQEPVVTQDTESTVNPSDRNPDVNPVQAEKKTGAKENETRKVEQQPEVIAPDVAQSEKPEPLPVVSRVNPNRFNRLLEERRSKTSRLHDKESPSLKWLQQPSEAFAELPKARTGNKVDWVKAVDSGKINPRHDLSDVNVKPFILDMNIVMQVKGSMPDVVFPHRHHTRWLNCSNCHPAIFIPQSGANKMSMADNLIGKRCGVCHGKVAFPLSACTKCHSNKKVVVKEKK